MAVSMKRCEKCGSFFNAAISPMCPTCNGMAQPRTIGQPMMGVQPSMMHGQQIGQPGMIMAQQLAGATVPIISPVDNNATVTVAKKDLEIDPVVGWLVCCDGAEKGRDYRIHADNNYIGRSERMDICIRGDDTISRENHAIITYDSREQVFYFTSGEGRSVVRLNGKAMLTTSQLEPYDEIEIGTTTLVFIPLCGQYFEWTSE